MWTQKERKKISLGNGKPLAKDGVGKVWNLEGARKSSTPNLEL